MMNIEEENRKLREELRKHKENTALSVMSWRSKYTKTAESLQREINSRDKQLRDIAASLILLESQLQKERKKMNLEMNQKTQNIIKLQNENIKLIEQASKNSEKVYQFNKPTPIPPSPLPKNESRKYRRSVSVDRNCMTDRRPSTDRSTERSIERSPRKTKPENYTSGQVVIDRKSREKRVEKNSTSDSSEEEKSLEETKKSKEGRRRVTRSMRDVSPMVTNRTRPEMRSEVDQSRSRQSKRSGSVGNSSTSSSDEPFEYLQIQRNPTRGQRSSTLPARCDPSLLNQWARNELEQGIII